MLSTSSAAAAVLRSYGKDLVCHYTAPAAKRKAEESPSPVRSTWIPSAVATPDHLKVNPLGNQGLTQGSYPGVTSTLLLLNSTPDAAPWQDLWSHYLAQPRGIAELFHHQVHGIIRATGQFVDDITVRYFEGVHNWIPVIARKRFHDDLFRFHTFPSADFSVLLLCVCLITYDPRRCSSQYMDHKSLYLATKMLVAQAQGILPASINTVQAVFLLSIFEYAHGQAEAAYVSITSSARMGYALGFDSKKTSTGTSDTENAPTTCEQRNVWWGIVTYERVIIVEVTNLGQPLATIFLSLEDPLPSEREFMNNEDGIGDNGLRSNPPLSSFHLESVGCFGREAQSAYLLDRVIGAIRLDDLDVKQAELSGIDQELQSFLGVIMEQCHGRWGWYCGAVGIAIR
ncbi:MAG: hypothetical protein MMC23_005796 [Stictis urceolatum]|nr:hypothetical protein [Stictis urceolata]